MRNFDLRDRCIVITGAAGGLGREAAIMMRNKGARVHVLDVGRAAIEAMRAQYPDIICHEADVSDAARIGQIFAGIGRIDALVNNASVQHESSFEGADLDDWRRTIDVNLTGTFICIQQALPHMGPGSTILNVLTHEGRRTNLYAYAASKAGIKNLTQNLAIALSDRAISINGIAYGAVYSQRNAHWQNDPEAVERALKRTPLHLILQPEEAAHQLVQFLEHSALYATGTVFDVSAGRSLT
ncbi:MAG: SDR family oxidoreductase [Clostridiales bacterium]|nr:SDR family oxidoreductase [Clostridiales bacterium]